MKTKDQNVRVVIADDHELFREGVKSLLANTTKYKVIGEAADGTRLINLVELLKPDIVITDIFMPGADVAEACGKITESFPLLKIIVLTMSNDGYLISDMIAAGVKGFLVKNAAAKELIAAMDAVNDDRHYFCSFTKHKAVDILRNPIQRIEKAEQIPLKLNLHERQILSLLCKEFTSKEIANQLNLSRRTVDSYRDRLFKKTNSKNLAGLVMFAVRYNLQ